MSLLRMSWQAALALILMIVALFNLPLVDQPVGLDAPATAMTTTFLAWLILMAAIGVDALPRPAITRAAALFVLTHLATYLLMTEIADGDGLDRLSFFLMIAASWLIAWRCVTLLSGIEVRTPFASALLRLLIPAIFGAWIVILWEAATRGAGIPFIILPPPSAIGVRIAGSVAILWADVQQTILKAVVFGYVVGCASGFVIAILADRISFLRRGLMPIGNLMSALPIVGVAPIMVMWFGFDWQSKAAVVIVMTFFPMLVNTVAGLSASGAMERDLMRSYASGYWQTLAKLRLPAAMPFIFNALKINSTLALIGAIVAEFFGTPIVGMGFRISTEIGRMNVDMVWAEIAVAALAGSVFYGIVALAERLTTFWHPSNRQG
ncbi:ABC transporter permease [Neorhizobium lilium]|uniref:ABC transporter permease n=1 Tax=Neorhizobium lilium TaxID=2503024 RepID=A0A444LIM5_9HYPH|nr:ABC transporter permease [Neorhizobium lilium]RWX78871.1 ABC transporter permease [Neorhizobium lilium]